MKNRRKTLLAISLLLILALGLGWIEWRPKAPAPVAPPEVAATAPALTENQVAPQPTSPPASTPLDASILQNPAHAQQFEQDHLVHSPWPPPNDATNTTTAR